ncbi:flagellar biosynthetic protein FliO [Pseudomonas sp.]|uniref:flagellar biosynthetic protein FliO n=1 Tax=unclassified Pseudomonas TaxID=196821 RepID=UPI001996D7EE|nr:flagellar biosynthetic protein FliO [Pseudomonas sp.]MBC6624370.1 flagellar biosynthetic protein FliO [Pseudomonas sp.]MBP6957805.1 flagellar biosynthetic protein FliO [Pseudomonas sp.]
MKYSMAGLLLALPLSALAAEPVAQVAAAPAVGSVGGQLTQLVLGLLLVIGLIFLLAWLMRRVQRIGPGNGQVIELVGSRALGPRDRLVLVQVGEEQILLGITPGRIIPLHVLKTPVDAVKTEAATPEFAQRLMELLGKDQKDKK